MWATLLALALADSTLAADTRPVSYYKDIVPLFKRSCTGCHHPGKLKGQLDLTTYEAFKKGGKHGPGFVASKPKESIIVEQISGSEPSMPKEGDPLTKEEVALIERWIEEGAKDDTPADAGSFKLAAPPSYRVPPVISALAYSPDGKHLAVSGYHEVLLLSADDHKPAARCVGESPRIESVAFAPDSKRLAVAGGAPARFGEVQIWDLGSGQQLKAFKIASDSLYGVSFSNDGDRVAVGCADKTVRVLQVSDGKELVKFDNHSDWVFGTLWTVDGTRLLTGSRDRAMKMINVANGQFIDDINKLLEPVLCIARHPKLDLVAYGGELGTPRIYRISDNQGRTAANNDVNLIREFERQPDAVRAIAYSPDASMIAVAGSWPEVRLYKTSDGARAHTLKGHTGAIFALAFHPSRNQLLTGGFDGKLRQYDTQSGALVSEFLPVTLEPVQQQASASTASSPARQ
jgi:WD40 repeat protein/mono/diheme cytochrome c family protein